MSLSIRRAISTDLAAIADLLMRDAEQRSALDPSLWRLAVDARARIESGLRAGLSGADASTPELWHVAEDAGRIVGVTHEMVVPVPPIYAVSAPPGLLLDDCCAAVDAPPGTEEALLIATEAALHTAGVSALIASCPAGGAWHPLYQRHGYEPVALYMAKCELSVRAAGAGVRTASPADVARIVALSADHRRTLARLNPRFWPTHPEADTRFAAWMHFSLTLADRDMLVAAAETGDVHGYIIAQPISPLLMPAAHDIAAIGVIDDFYGEDFADVADVANAEASASNLLSAGESALRRRGFTAVLAVCPAAWISKISVLERNGYRIAKLWMLKRS